MAHMRNINGDFNFEIKEEIAVLSAGGRYSLELNRVSFNGHPANYDIRWWGWNDSVEKYPARGVSLTRSELAALKKQLNEMDEI